MGKAGTGFTQKMILELHDLLPPITLDKTPLAKKPTQEQN
jgi:hypothetical protein